MPKFDQPNVYSCTPSEPLEISRENYPWISVETACIPAFQVELDDETSFRFGSLIGLNNSIKKIADSVPSESSSSAQTALFMGLPAVLNGLPASGISKVENSSLSNSTLLIVSRNLVSAAGLVIAIEKSSDTGEVPTVLRAGISHAKDRANMLAVMGVKQTVGKRRRSW